MKLIDFSNYKGDDLFKLICECGNEAIITLNEKGSLLLYNDKSQFAKDVLLTITGDYEGDISIKCNKCGKCLMER